VLVAVAAELSTKTDSRPCSEPRKRAGWLHGDCLIAR